MHFKPGQHSKPQTWGDYTSPIPSHPDDDWRFNPNVPRPKDTAYPAFWRGRDHPPIHP